MFAIQLWNRDNSAKLIVDSGDIQDTVKILKKYLNEKGYIITSAQVNYSIDESNDERYNVTIYYKDPTPEDESNNSYLSCNVEVAKKYNSIAGIYVIEGFKSRKELQEEKDKENAR